MWTELFAAVGREVTVQEPVMTWNLFLTAILVPLCSAITTAIIVGYFNRKMKKKEANDIKYRIEREKKEDEINSLLRQLDNEKQNATFEWRKHHTDTLCKVKERVDDFYNAIDRKVDKHDCDRLMGNSR